MVGHAGETCRARDPPPAPPGGQVPAGAIPTVSSQQGLRGPCLGLSQCCLPVLREALWWPGSVGMAGAWREVSTDPTPLSQGSRVYAEKSGDSPNSEPGSQALTLSLCSYVQHEDLETWAGVQGEPCVLSHPLRQSLPVLTELRTAAHTARVTIPTDRLENRNREAERLALGHTATEGRAESHIHSGLIWSPCALHRDTLTLKGQARKG